jgi:hypothetical protein
MKKVAIVQSTYIPWKGYFDLAHPVGRADRYRVARISGGLGDAAVAA